MSESSNFLVTIMNWRISGQGYEHFTRFSGFICSNQQLVLCKRLTLSAASIFVTEGLFIHIYFMLFEKKSSKSDFQSWKKISRRISLFFR